MPRIARIAPGGLIYHVLNRGVGRMDLFEEDGDFAAFLKVLAAVRQEVPIRLLGYCLMSNHWHLVLWPEREGQLARFMQRLTITHVRRWVEHRHRVGWGSIYQGRYKSFVVQEDAHLLSLLRYVERNPLRAGMVQRAQDWRWSSLGQAYIKSDPDQPKIELDDWPIERPKDWLRLVNRPQNDAEEQAMRRSITLSRPWGDVSWTAKMEKRLGMPPVRPRGRPRKQQVKTDSER